MLFSEWLPSPSAVRSKRSEQSKDQNKITFAKASLCGEHAAGTLSATDLLHKKLKHGKCCFEQWGRAEEWETPAGRQRK